MSEPPPLPKREKPPPLPKREDTDEEERLLQQLIDALTTIKKLSEKITHLEYDVTLKEFMVDQRSLTINKIKTSLRDTIQEKEMWERLYNKQIMRPDVNRVNLVDYYVNTQYTDIRAHGSTITDRFFKIPEGMTVFVVSPLGKCTTFGNATKLYNHVKMGKSLVESDQVRGGIYRSGEVMFDASLTFSDIKEKKNTFMHLGIFPFVAKPIWIDYSQLTYWFEAKGENDCKQLFDGFEEKGPDDLDEVIEGEECMHSWLEHVGDLRWVLPIYRRSDKDQTKLSTLLYGIDKYLKKYIKKHIPKKIILDCCLPFIPNDTDGTTTAKLVTQLEEFKEHQDVVANLPRAFDWSNFMIKLRD